MIKRSFDMIAALLLMVVFSPIWLGGALIILIMLGRPIFFVQERIGLNGRIFTIVKFRTMCEAQSLRGELLADEERLTTVGLWLRKYSLDELPEFWNVLKGDMSLVGPRPLLVEYLNLYSKEQMRRHEVRPGITGLAQVKGRNAISWEERFRFDVWYVDNQSLWLDLRILCLTIVRVFRADGISQPGHVTMEKFKGSI